MKITAVKSELHPKAQIRRFVAGRRTCAKPVHFLVGHVHVSLHTTPYINLEQIDVLIWH